MIEKELPGPPDLEVQVWNKHTFRPSRATFKTLSDTAERCDFAIMVLRGDDLTVSRGSKSLSPRDNVIFELGLFAGALGRADFYRSPEEKASISIWRKA